MWVVAGGGCWALGFFFFFPLQNAFSSLNTRWFGASPVLAKPSREAALVSACSGIEAVAGEGSVSYGAFVQLRETLWIPKSRSKMGAFIGIVSGLPGEAGV